MHSFQLWKKLITLITYFDPYTKNALFWSLNWFLCFFSPDMKTYFITGRASPNYVPFDTRMARRTSSNPASFLIPSITHTDITVSLSTNSKQYVSDKTMLVKE